MISYFFLRSDWHCSDVLNFSCVYRLGNKSVQVICPIVGSLQNKQQVAGGYSSCQLALIMSYVFIQLSLVYDVCLFKKKKVYFYRILRKGIGQPACLRMCPDVIQSAVMTLVNKIFVDLGLPNDFISLTHKRCSQWSLRHI